jgi:hypothetical protein
MISLQIRTSPYIYGSSTDCVTPSPYFISVLLFFLLLGLLPLVLFALLMRTTSASKIISSSKHDNVMPKY